MNDSAASSDGARIGISAMLRHSHLTGMQLRWIAYAKANASGTVRTRGQSRECERVAGRAREARETRNRSRNWRGRRTRRTCPRRLRTKIVASGSGEKHEQSAGHQHETAARGERLAGERDAPRARHRRPSQRSVFTAANTRTRSPRSANATRAPSFTPSSCVWLSEKYTSIRWPSKPSTSRLARQYVPRKSMWRTRPDSAFGIASTGPESARMRSSGRR